MSNSEYLDSLELEELTGTKAQHIPLLGVYRRGTGVVQARPAPGVEAVNRAGVDRGAGAGIGVTSATAPPKEAGPGRDTTPGPGTPTPHQASPKTSNADRSGIEFRDWFRRGALDALRLMGQALPLSGVRCGGTAARRGLPAPQLGGVENDRSAGRERRQLPCIGLEVDDKEHDAPCPRTRVPGIVKRGRGGRQRRRPDFVDVPFPGADEWSTDGVLHCWPSLHPDHCRCPAD